MNGKEQRDLSEGLYFWNVAFKGAASDACALQGITRFFETTSPPLAAGDIQVYWAAKLAMWVHHGFTKLLTSHGYAAALMATSAAFEADDLIVQWKCFVVVVPDGLLDDERGTYNRIQVTLWDGETEIAQGNSVSIDVYSTEHARTIKYHFSDHVALLRPDEGTVTGAVGPPVSDRAGRVMLLARRLVAGLLYTVQHTSHFHVRERSRTERGEPRGGPPQHRNVFIGRPLPIDCRPQVRAYLVGDVRSAPSVQSLVRGHYKRQVVGVARGGRKVIWVEPYWRGPEDAPILARPRLIK